MRTEDGYIIDQCLNGDSAAFGLLVDKYKESTYALAYAKLGNFHDAEDITQKVFIKAYTKLRTLRRGDNFLAWLYAITSNLCKNFLRSRSRRPDGEYVEEQGRKILDPRSMNAYREGLVYDSLYEALDALPEIYRQVLTLYYLGGMSTREIARFLGVSPNTVEQRLSRARSKLKKEIIAMMSATFDRKKLLPGFTFCIVERVKQAKIQFIPHTSQLPWEALVTTGIVLTLLSLTPYLIPLIPTDAGSSLPGGTQAVDMVEIPTLIRPVKERLINRSYLPMTLRRSPQPGDQPKRRVSIPTLGGEKAPQPLPSINPTIEFSGQAPDLMTTPVMIVAKVPAEPQDVVVSLSPMSPRYAQSGEGLFTPRFRLPDRGKTRPDSLVSTVEPTRMIDSTNLSGTRSRFGFANEAALTGSSPTKSVVFSPDGQLLANGAKLWSVAERREIATLEGHSSRVWCVAFSPDGQLLASGARDGITLWSIAKGEEIAALKGHGEVVYAVAFSPDGQTLASVSWARERTIDRTITLWSVAERGEITTLIGYGGVACSVGFSPDGQLLASGMWNGTVKLWSVANGGELATFTGHRDRVWSIAFSPDGQTLASGAWDGTIKLWSVAEQKEIATLKGHSSRVWSVAFSPDGQLLASGSSDCTIKLWSVVTGREVATLTGHSDQVWSVAFSPDGQLLASGAWDGTKLWKVQEVKAH